MPKALITGISGFVASNLAIKLENEGWDIIGIKRSSSKLNALAEKKNRIKLYNYDGSNDSLKSAFSNKPDVVFHVASWYLREHKEEQISELLQSNITFSSQLAENAINSGCKNFINTSSFTLFDKNGNYAPDSLYSATKKAFCDILEYYSNCKNLNIITLYLYDNYGANDLRQKLFWLFDQSANHGKKIDFTKGEQRLFPVYIDDTTQAFKNAYEILENSAEKNINLEFFVAEKDYSLKEIAKTYEKISNKKLNINWGAIPYRENQIMKPFLGKKLPNWQQKIDLEEGIRKLLSAN